MEKSKLARGLQSLSLAVLIVLIAFALVVSCDNGFIASILPTRAPKSAEDPSQPRAGEYTIVIDISGNESGDTVTASPDNGIEGGTVKLTYNVANTAHYNVLDIGGVTASIASVNGAGHGTMTYVINADDASNGVITITAVFEHTNLKLDPIAFTDTEGHIIKTYGDAPFTNDIMDGYRGSGAITYRSSNTGVAAVDGSGQVTILRAGSAIITAEKAADAVYAHAQAEYTLAVNPKPVTITGLSVANKRYDGTTTATVTGTAVINGKIDGDDLSVSAGTAAFTDALVGNDKAVIFNGWSLTGEDVGYYTLSAQPSVTANIELVSMIETVPIPAGTFTMGSPAGEPGRYTHEGPQHSVTLSGFKMSKYQVTQEQYQDVTGTNPSYFTTVNGRAPAVGESDEKRPMDYATWYDAVEFCNKLSALEGLQSVYTINGRTPALGYPITSATVTADLTQNGYRLPTEAQWEYACRAGTITVYNTGDTISDDTGWYASNSGIKTHQVGLKPANAWGLYDMHGNVMDWCWDLYGSYSSESQTNPMGASSGTSRVRRGGHFNTSSYELRSAYRDRNSPDMRSSSYGFRLVRP